MARITEEMARMVAELRLCYVATVTPDGKPNLSPKGSLCVIDGDHLAFADIMSPGTMRNLRSNPFINTRRAKVLRYSEPSRRASAPISR